MNINSFLLFIGQQVALVGKQRFFSFAISLILIYIGSSGCGKSTTIQLIERFYDASVGQLVRQSFFRIHCLTFFCSVLIQKMFEVLIFNGIDHKVCNTFKTCSFFIKNEYFLVGFVSQEPVLFDMSIKENIAYGDNSRDDIPMEEIIEAAKNANIHHFIQSLPEVSHRIRSFIEKKKMFSSGI
jgi:ABC-type multidrug transport system fused ATPase/permease subunit